ncbi:MAG TPA: hypothetical protein VEN99_11205 [Acidimicrobiia bacterium]|nr:hypothetical protein [Acidimicrobiia bacterium]
MLLRNRIFPVVALVVGVVAAACGGGHSYKAGTPAATGQAPDCSAVPLDLVNTTLALTLTGPVAGSRPGGVVCTFAQQHGGASVQQVLLNSNVDKATFALVRDGFKAANNPVKKISGWGDEAYAASVFGLATSNNFAVRKGKVSVVITSTADYDHMKKLMKAVLAKL